MKNCSPQLLPLVSALRKVWATNGVNLWCGGEIVYF